MEASESAVMAISEPQSSLLVHQETIGKALDSMGFAVIWYPGVRLREVPLRIMAKNDELDSLVASIIESTEFRGAPQRGALLNYLWQNRGEYSKPLDIWEGALHEYSRSKHKDEAEYNFEDSVRQSCLELRKSLHRYCAGLNEGWGFMLPSGTPGRGYQLQPVPLNKYGASNEFWRGHAEAESIVLVYTEPTFYYDILKDGYIRFLDTNPQSDDKELALAELERRHGEELQGRDGIAIRERLRPTHVYVGIGEVAALEMLSQWFYERAGLQVQKVASGKISSVSKCAPILLGNMRTNRFISSFLRSREGQHFHYRLHETMIGHVAIENADDKEIKALGGFSPSRDEKGRTVAGQRATLSAVRDRFAVLTRMPNPGGTNSVTMISSDTTLAIQQVAMALTDNKQTYQILTKLGWPEEPLPPSFEMLFSVQIGAGDIDDDSTLPKLLAYRKYL